MTPLYRQNQLPAWALWAALGALLLSFLALGAVTQRAQEQNGPKMLATNRAIQTANALPSATPTAAIPAGYAMLRRNISNAGWTPEAQDLRLDAGTLFKIAQYPQQGRRCLIELMPNEQRSDVVSVWVDCVSLQ